MKNSVIKIAWFKKKKKGEGNIFFFREIVSFYKIYV